MEDSSLKKSSEQQKMYKLGTMYITWMYIKIFVAVILTAFLLANGLFLYFTTNKVFGVILIAGAAAGLFSAVLISYKIWRDVIRYSG